VLLQRLRDGQRRPSWDKRVVVRSDINFSALSTQQDKVKERRSTLLLHDLLHLGRITMLGRKLSAEHLPEYRHDLEQCLLVTLYPQYSVPQLPLREPSEGVCREVRDVRPRREADLGVTAADDGDSLAGNVEAERRDEVVVCELSGVVEGVGQVDRAKVGLQLLLEEEQAVLGHGLRSVAELPVRNVSKLIDGIKRCFRLTKVRRALRLLPSQHRREQAETGNRLR